MLTITHISHLEYVLTAITDDYRYSVTTNLAGVTPDLNRMATVVQLPSKYLSTNVLPVDLLNYFSQCPAYPKDDASYGRSTQ